MAPFRISLNAPLLILTVLFAGPARARGQSESPDPIRNLNGAFRQAYGDARTRTLAGSGPVILVTGDKLALLRDGQRIEGTTVDRQYHDLKTIAHLPLCIYLLLAPCEEGPIDAPRLDGLRQLQALIERVKPIIDQRFPDRKVARRQHRLLKQCRSFTSQVSDTAQYNHHDLAALITAQRPRILANTRAAAKLRIDNYHRQALAWRSSMTAEEWGKLHVVVQGAPMPRQDNLAVQYFAKLLGQPGEGSKIVYAESLFTDSQALKLLGTHLLDSQIGQDFFADPWRMHRDLLGSAAADYIDRLQMNND